MEKETIQDKNKRLFKSRYNLNVKSNAIIQKASHPLKNAEQQKLYSYLVSRIKDRNEKNEIIIIASEYFVTTGKAHSSKHVSSRYYNELEKNLQEIKNTKFYIKENGIPKELCGFIDKVEKLSSGKFLVKYNEESIKKYFCNLTGYFTKYVIIWVLLFHSKYSLPIYEFCKSISYNTIGLYSRRDYTLKEIKFILAAVNYSDYHSLTTRVFFRALYEINFYSDIRVTIIPHHGVGTKKIETFTIKVEPKDDAELNLLEKYINQILGFPKGTEVKYQIKKEIPSKTEKIIKKKGTPSFEEELRKLIAINKYYGGNGLAKSERPTESQPAAR